MSRTIGSVDDAGFNVLYKSGESSTTPSGDSKPESGTTEPQRTTSRIAGFDTVSPFDIDGGTGDGTSNGTGGNQSSKRRGRPPGSKNRTSTEKAIQSSIIPDLDSLLMSVHFMASRWFALHELEMEESEAKRYANHLQNLARFYPVSIDPKKMAWLQFSLFMTEFYGSRGIAIYKRLKTEAEKKPAKVTPIRESQTDQPKPNGLDSQPLTPSQVWNESPIDEPL